VLCLHLAVRLRFVMLLVCYLVSLLRRLATTVWANDNHSGWDQGWLAEKLPTSPKIAKTHRQSPVNEDIRPFHQVEVEMGAWRIAAVAYIAEQCAPPDDLAFVDLKAGLL
jgi:hypothetical protein